MSYCSDANIEISGTANTEDLVAEVKAFSDGYYMKSTVASQ